MQPLQYDVRCPAAKENSITHAAAAPSNLDAAITMRFAKTELQSTIERRATASEIAAPKPDGSRRQSKKSPAPKLRNSADKSLSQPWCSHSNTMCVQLQKTNILCRQPPRQATLTQPLQCTTSLKFRRISWLWASLGCEISWLWDLLAVRFLGCEISLLWDLLAVRSLCCAISWAVRSLGCDASWLWDSLAVRSLGCAISWLWWIDFRNP